MKKIRITTALGQVEVVEGDSVEFDDGWLTIYDGAEMVGSVAKPRIVAQFKHWDSWQIVAPK